MEHAFHQDGRWSWSQTWPTKRMLGPDRLRSVGFIERVEDPAVLSQHRSIKQGDATGMSPSGPGVGGEKGKRKDDA